MAINYDHRKLSEEAHQRRHFIAPYTVRKLDKKIRDRVLAASYYQGEKPLWYLKCFFKACAIKTIIWIKMRFKV